MSAPSIGQALGAAVVAATANPQARPRGGQQALTEQVWAAMNDPGQRTHATAGTGTGKSLAYLTPAALAAATTGARTVISTESLALQSQIIDKDAPVVAGAIEDLTGTRPEVAVLKGWSNYACARSAIMTAHQLLGRDKPPPKRAPSSAELNALADDLGALMVQEDTEVHLAGRTVWRTAAANETAWALRQHTSPVSGDRNTLPGAPACWEALSVTPAECIGVKTCPLASLCKPAAAKQAAADADIIVTNHSLLGVQAAKAIGIVVGSQRIGRIDNIVIDEAHALPAQVRNQGAAEVSARRIGGILTGLRGLLDETGAYVRQHLELGDTLTRHVGDELGKYAPSAGTKATEVRLEEGQDPLARTGEHLVDWLTSSQTLVSRSVRDAGGIAETRVRRLRARLDTLKDDIAQVREHRIGVARWVENDQADQPVARSTPIDVAGLLAANLWTAPVPQEDPDEDLAAQADLSDEEDQRYHLSVAAVSATLPRGFGIQAAISGKVAAHPSPFDAAYAGSALFVPRADNPGDIAALAHPGSGGRKPSMDPARHREWATGHIIDLVRAAGGRALVLSATAASGRHYTQALAAALPHLTVYSQWEGLPLRTAVAAWKDEETSVMVGTRSLMTGVDAPGPTCSLVIIDRVPRAASNPVDEARVEDLAQRAGVDKWAGVRGVYAADATLLLEQAAGRLVRSVSDRGMVAVLDPRLLKLKPWAYEERTRALYQSALSAFGTKISAKHQAIEFLHHLHSAGQVAA